MQTRMATRSLKTSDTKRTAPCARRQGSACLRSTHAAGARRADAKLRATSGINPFASASSTPAASATAGQANASAASTSEPSGPWSEHTWKWKGHTIHYKTAGCGEPIIMVHGFGLSSFHYRRNIPVLAEKYKVYAIDLLGFGRSSKPVRQYSMELWRDLLLDFMAEFTSGKGAVLVGNSIGALACLMTAAAAPGDAVKGTVLLNSAGAMNNKGVIGDWRILAVYPLLLLIDFLLSIPAVSASLFNNFRTKDNIAQVLRNGVYSNPSNVDQALVDEIYAPSCDAGAREVFVSVITGPPGPKPWNLLPDISSPLLVLWGDKDTLTPADGPVGRLFKDLPQTRPETSFVMLPDVGHCLHDDKPELVHAQLLPWLDNLFAGRPTCAQVGAAAAAGRAGSAAGGSVDGALPPVVVGEDDIVEQQAGGSKEEEVVMVVAKEAQ